MKALSKREKQILQLIVDGMNNKEIASALTISEKTVKNQIGNLLRKMDVRDRTQAAVRAIGSGMVTLKDNGYTRCH